MFLVGLNGYNQRLFEDSTVNKMHESLKLFKQARKCFVVSCLDKVNESAIWAGIGNVTFRSISPEFPEGDHTAERGDTETPKCFKRTNVRTQA